MPLYIDGTKMPEPKMKPKFGEEKIWSSDTARGTTSLMNGKIKGIKKTISLVFPPLTISEKNKITAIVSNKNKPFVSMKLTDTDGNIIVDKEVYFGTPSYTVYSGAKGLRYVIDFTVDGIER